jgi:hypothetical protein
MRRAGRLAIALEKFEPPPPPVSLVYGGQRLLPLKLRAFLDFAAPRLRRGRPRRQVCRKPSVLNRKFAASLREAKRRSNPALGHTTTLLDCFAAPATAPNPHSRISSSGHQPAG